jgi:hypothetical protein
VAATPTLREQVDSFLDISGADNFGDAQSQITSWRDQAKGTGGGPSQADYDSVNHQLEEIFEACEAKDHATALTNINGLSNSIRNLWGALEVKDEESAINGIKALKSDHAKFQGEIKKLEGEKEDFEKRVNAEVIARAASAGVPTPIKKPSGVTTATGTREANTMSRAEFNTMSPLQQVEFSRNGGKLSD